MSNSEEELRVELAEHYKRLEAKGLTELASGNVSCRIDDDMLISPSGATADSISAENIVRVSFSARVDSARGHLLCHWLRWAHPAPRF